MLQHMVDRAKAEPNTDISVIFSSGSLDRLAAVLQVVLSSQTCYSVATRTCISAMRYLSVHVVELTAEFSNKAYREVALHR